VNIRKARLLRPLIRSLSLTLILTQLSAQTAHRRSPQLPSSFPLLSVKVTGSKRYASGEIAAATGLQPGQTVSKSDFELATEHLGESGAFSSVSYSFEYSGEGAKLELQVSDSNPFVPAYFDNFVWFSNQELLADLRSRVPLFQGQLPSEGKLADQVSDALQTMLVERNVQGRVNYLRNGPDNGPLESFLYSVDGPTIRIRNLEFKGADPKDVPLLQAAGAQLQGQDYLRSTITGEADKNLAPIYVAQGFLKASFADYDAKVVQQSDQETDVDVTFTVNPGRQYKVKEIHLSGSNVLPAEQLRALLHQQLGQPANAIQLVRDTEAMKKLYGTHGYMAASIQVTPTMDEAASTVSYQLQVNEGDLYHMGELDFQDLDRHDRERVAAKWSLAKGDPYDSGYPKRFVNQILKEVLTTGEFNVSIRELPDPADKSVDVSIKFERKEEL